MPRQPKTDNAALREALKGQEEALKHEQARRSRELAAVISQINFKSKSSAAWDDE